MAKETWRELTDLLGLSETATQDEVKKAYRSFAKTDHPDRNPNSDKKEKFARVSTLIGFMNKGQLSADSQPEVSIEEEDPFADVKAQKEKIKNVANPIYEPINGKHITIERTINGELAEKGGKLVIPITGTALLESNLVRQKSISVDIKPKSWGKHQVVLTGKGRPGLFGGKSGDLIISIKSEPLKAPITPAPIPRPTPENNKSAAAKFFAEDQTMYGENTKVRPAVLPKAEFPPKPFPAGSTSTNMTDEEIYPSAVLAANTVAKVIYTPKQIRYAVIVLILSVLLTNYVSNNVDTRNSDDASFYICQASNSMHATIFFDKFYNFESPYKAAIYYNYFKEDFDAQDMVAEIGNQYPRIQSAQYSNIKSAGAQLSQAFYQNDNSIVSAMNRMQKACASVGYEWNE
jgi:hypothetical protein